MEDQTHPASAPNRYHLTLMGHLDVMWADWFSGCTITAQADGTTLVEVEVVDQAMLYGLIPRARNLGLTLIGLQRAGSRPLKNRR